MWSSRMAAKSQVEKVNFSSIPGFQYTPLIVGVIVSGDHPGHRRNPGFHSEEA